MSTGLKWLIRIPLLLIIVGGGMYLMWDGIVQYRNGYEGNFAFVILGAVGIAFCVPCIFGIGTDSSYWDI